MDSVNSSSSGHTDLTPFSPLVSHSLQSHPSRRLGHTETVKQRESSEDSGDSESETHILPDDTRLIVGVS